MNRILLLCLSLLLVGCFGSQSASSGGRTGLFQSFYVGEEGTQYFIKPLALKGKQDDCYIDFNFRSAAQLSGETTANFSFFAAQPVHKLQEAFFEVAGTRFDLQQSKSLFVETQKDNFKCRFTSVLPTPSLKPLFATSQWKLILIDDKGNSYHFTSDKSTEKKILTLRQRLFSIFQ